MPNQSLFVPLKEKDKRMKERIREVMEYAHQSQQDFAARLGISPASLSSIFTGRTNPTNNHVMAVHRAFPEVNINWLMFGEGEMLPEATLSAEDGGEPADPPAGVVEAESQPRAEAQTALQSPSLFAMEEAAIPSPAAQPSRAAYGSRREAQAPQRPVYGIAGSAINIDKQTRKIKEIRVFFDDGTYEAFVPSGK